VRDEYCYLHFKYKKKPELPLWKWVKGVLFRRHMIPIPIDKDFHGRDPQYFQHCKFIARRMWGEIDHGYSVHFIDGNPFNYKKNNLILLSKIATSILNIGKISLADAYEIDEVIGKVVKQKCGDGRPKLKWIYGYDDIAAATDMFPESIRGAVTDKKLDPGNLVSVAHFIAKRSKAV
jgi:hypothetical protein